VTDFCRLDLLRTASMDPRNEISSLHRATSPASAYAENLTKRTGENQHDRHQAHSPHRHHRHRRDRARSWTRAVFSPRDYRWVRDGTSRPNAESRAEESSWRPPGPALKRLGLSPGSVPVEPQIPRPNLAQALCRPSTSSRRNGPERIDFKKKLYGQLDELLPPDVIIASSSSGLTMSENPSRAPRPIPERLRHRPSVQSAPLDPRWSRIVRRGKDLGSDNPAVPGGILYVDRATDGCALNKEMPGHVRQPPPGCVGA